ncbi:type 1 glutamine amidotransferase [Ruegeria marina]|uniref:GMP synthase-Glutamine amidotransferase n=1 Tax=Ruegeria marina TaxID=639004 RepID=A0A1G7C5A8_9RHOB|nr:type 1 glutamine amidotransferase [Ruegeria marina]SDE34487.1 GMP synthase-Glutamine amidotransferase [Ruegeria marina]
MRVLILQHAEFEHAGRFRALFAREGIETQTVLMPEARSLPALDAFDALWVLGGVMQVWETDKYPWLLDEIDLIRRAVAEAGKPYFGICFGHQLLAAALGGEVGPAAVAEFGVIPVRRSGPVAGLLEGLPEVFHAFSWHSAEVKALPPGHAPLAGTGDCGNQHMTGAGAVGSVQFHPEIDTETMRDWFASPGVINDLKPRLGPDPERVMIEMLERHEAELSHLAETLFANWLARARASLG